MTMPEIGSGLPEVVLRVALVYLFLVVVLRLSGKREVGQMSILELIVVLLISDAVQNSMVGENTTRLGRSGRRPDPPRARLRAQPPDAAARARTAQGDRGRATAARPRRPAPAARRCARRSSTSRTSETAVRAHGLARIDEVRAGHPRDRRLDQRDPEGRGRQGHGRRGRLADEGSGRLGWRPVQDVGLEERQDPLVARRAGSRGAPSRGPRRRTSGPRGACPRSRAPRPSARSSAGRRACPCGRGG